MSLDENGAVIVCF